MMASKLRTREVASLHRALENERYSNKLAQEKNLELQKALDCERSAIRALRRELAAQVRAAKEEENSKHAAMLEQLKIKMTLGQTEAIEMHKESTARALTAEFQKEIYIREEQIKKDARKQILQLQEQLKEALKSQQQEFLQSEKDALIHSLHAEFQRTLHAKQEEWKRDTKMQLERVSCQLAEAQRQCQELTGKLVTTTSDAEQAGKLRQDMNALKMQNKQLEERIQMLTEGERRKVEEFRSQYEEFETRLNDMQKAARKEASQLLEEMKGKDRHIAELERELHHLATRLDIQREQESCRVRSNSSSRLRLDAGRPGEPPRFCMKRPTNSMFVTDLKKADSIEQATDQRSIPVLNSMRSIKTCTSEGKTNDDLLNNSWTKVVGLDTLYKLLSEEHQELQKTHQTVCAKLRDEERCRIKLEEQLRECKRAENENAINLAMAGQIQTLQEQIVALETEAQELREQNDLLEFRILELDDGMCSNVQAKSSSSRTPDTRDGFDLDDISDSGVMSLTTSEDISEADFQDFKIEPNNREIKNRLIQLYQTTDNVNDQVHLQQALTLIRHYESRLESLEATLAAMCQEAAMTRSNSILSDISSSVNSESLHIQKSPSRIIATVQPFTDLSSNYEKDTPSEQPIKKLIRDVDCLQESGIFESSADLITQGTQTDWTVDKYCSTSGDLSTEIRKLSQIRERIEEQGGNKKLLKVTGDDDIITHNTLKALIFYKERLQLIENKLAVYESEGDKQSKLLAARLEREVLLQAHVDYLTDTVQRLREENRELEEEKCEFEEAENDTRLRCQKLEVKLSALGEKKSDLQVQLQQNARTLSNLRSTLSEEERKRIEGKQRIARLENTICRLEQNNFELEEKEMEVRCKLQVLEVTLPALIVWILWNILNSMGQFRNIAITPTEPSNIEKNMKARLQDLEAQLVFEQSQLTQSKNSEKLLTNRIKELMQILKTKEDEENGLKYRLESSIKINDLKSKCTELEDKIKEYETREKTYTSTIQEVEEFWAKEKADLRDVIENLEEKLMFKDKELDKVGNQMKRLNISQEVETQLQEHIQQLHQEMSELREKLLQREKENKVKEDAEKHLWLQLNEAVEQIDYFKTNIEVALREEIKQLKKKNKELNEQLELTSQSEQEDRDTQTAIIQDLRSSLRKKTKDLEENEVNIGELKEEVLTLEKALIELRIELTDERNKKEITQIEVSRELAARDEEIKRLKYELCHERTESLAESLNEETDLLLEYPGDVKHRMFGAEPQVETYSTLDVAASRSQTKCSHLPADCFKSQLMAATEEYISTDEDVPHFIDRLQTIFEHSDDCKNCKDKGTAEKIHQILKAVSKLDINSMKADCFNTRLAMHRFTSSADLLQQSLQHSKDCQNCINGYAIQNLQEIINRIQNIYMTMRQV